MQNYCWKVWYFRVQQGKATAHKGTPKYDPIHHTQNRPKDHLLVWLREGGHPPE